MMIKREIAFIVLCSGGTRISGFIFERVVLS